MNYKLQNPRIKEFELINLKTEQYETVNDSFESNIDLTSENFNEELK